MTDNVFQLKDCMATPPALPRFGPPYTAEIVRSLARCTGAIAALNARLSVSPVAKPWRMRASWNGYATALQLQGVEVDEIDIYSWGCGLRISTRPPLSTNLDTFGDFPKWQLELSQSEGPAWRDRLPTTIGEPHTAREHPPLVRALDLVRQHSQCDGSAVPWLRAPIILRGLGLTSTTLPCLTGGLKAFRLKRTPADTDWAAAFNGLTRAAEAGLDSLDNLEKLHRRAMHILRHEYRPGALPRLIALSLAHPLLSPQYVATALGLSVAGASKLIDRAVEAELLVEITQRKTWRQFLTPDLAVLFGFTAPKRGRPRADPAIIPDSRPLADAFEQFDREMAAIDRLLGANAIQPTDEPGIHD